MKSKSSVGRILKSIAASLLVAGGLLFFSAPCEGVSATGGTDNCTLISFRFHFANNTADNNSSRELLYAPVKCTEDAGKEKVSIAATAGMVNILLYFGQEHLFCNLSSVLSALYFPNGSFTFHEFLYFKPLRSPPFCC